MYRAVQPGELDDIKANGFRNPEGIENKYFTDSAENAKAYGDKAQEVFKDGPYTVVETSIPSSSIKPDMRANPADIPGGLPTVVVPTEKLGELSPPKIRD